jgi:glutamine synthetase
MEEQRLMMMVILVWFLQEYFIMDTKTLLPLGFLLVVILSTRNVLLFSRWKNTHGRQLVEEHADLCIAAGINFEGINQEVACGQWEFQLFA